MLLTSGVIVGDEYLGAWSVWWAGDAMGILVVAPVLLMLTTIREQPVPHGWRVLEAIVLAGVLVVISSLIVATDLPVAFLVFPVLGWAAWRFQQLGATPAALLVRCSPPAAAEGRGPSRLDLPEQMFTLQAFNASVALMSFFFAAIVSERLRARRALEGAAADLEERVVVRTAELTAANERLAEAQRLAHLGSWDWDVASGAVTWSEEMFRIHGIEPDGQPMTFERAIASPSPRSENASDRTGERPREGRGGDPGPRVPDPPADGEVEPSTGRRASSSRPTGRSADGRHGGGRHDPTGAGARAPDRRHAPAGAPAGPAPAARRDRPRRAIRAGRGGSAAGGDWYDVLELGGGRPRDRRRGGPRLGGGERDGAGAHGRAGVQPGGASARRRGRARARAIRPSTRASRW